MQRLDRILSRVESGVILVSYLTLVGLVGVETIRRILTGGQAVWGPEVALYAFVWLSWFSMAKHLRDGTHLAFTELRRRLSAGLQRTLEALDCILWMVIGIIIIAGSIQVVQTNLEMNQVLFGTDIPLAAVSLAVPVGWGISMLRAVQRLCLTLSGKTAATAEEPKVALKYA